MLQTRTIAGGVVDRTVRLALQSFSQLDTPLGLHLGYTQQSGTHDCDDETGYDAKDTFPDLLYCGPIVNVQAVECSNQSTTDNKANGEADERAPPYLRLSVTSFSMESKETDLIPELAVYRSVLIFPKLLFDKG